MKIGLTTVDPRIQETPSSHIWVVNTRTGRKSEDGQEVGRWHFWKHKRNPVLERRNVISITLTEDRTIFITLKSLRKHRVFENLPSGPLWVYLEMQVRKINIMYPGNVVFLCFFIY